MMYRLILLLFALFFLFSCEKDAIDREEFGSIHGFVIDSETDERVSNANITTTPPTNSILTAEDGTFDFNEVPAGSYSIQARKSGYSSNSVNVTVRKDQTAIANIPLTPSPEPDDNDDDDEDEDNGNENDD